MEMMTNECVREYSESRIALCARIKQIIIEQINIDIDPKFITDDQPLFGRGLELDSIDALELSVGIYNEFNVTVSDGNTSIFSSVNSIADYIMKSRSNRDDHIGGNTGKTSETSEDIFI